MVEQILQSHFTRYPEIQIQDVYKLVHQAALGCEHAISDPEDARVWLEREVSEMGEGPVEPVMDTISADGEILRIHLRPYIANGKKLETLFTAFLRTAAEYRGDLHVLEHYWNIAVSMGQFPASDMQEFMRPVEEKNYPAVHHSDIYQKLYRPAYRVVWKKSFTGMS